MENMLERLVYDNQIIWLDTSFAMDNHFPEFIEEIEPILEEKRTKIVVHDMVWAELLRHCESDEPSKQKSAGNAVNIISRYKQIFEVNNMWVNSSQMLFAFADPLILAEITAKKRWYSQALITNDKGLGRDVNRLNNQESCPGKKVTVYRFDYSGNLELYSQCGEVEKECRQEEVVIKEVPKEVIKEVVRVIPAPPIINKNISFEEKGHNYEAAGVGGAILGMVFGVVIGKNSNQIAKYIETFIKAFV